MASPILLVHYHEIGLKGRNRSLFEQKLIKNIEFLCKDLPVEKVSRISGKVLVCIDRNVLQGHANEDGFVPGGLKHPLVQQIFNQLCLVPGVARVSVGWRTNRDWETMLRIAADVLQDAVPFETWKVNARRSNTDFPIHTMDLNRQIGDYLAGKFPDKTVRMEDPDAVVHVQIIQGSTYIYSRTQQATGGLPVGSAGKFVTLLSTGIDSPVATWRIIHRGGIGIGLHFSGAPETDDSSEYLVRDIVDGMAQFGGIQKLYIAKIGEYQKRISEIVPPRLRVIFFRRLMMTVANEIAWREHAKCIVTGESLGQVASQTMENIRAVDAVAKYPVLRPLIGTDKIEIIEMAQQIGTYDLSTQACADCCTLYLPRNPETHANLAEVEELAAQMDFESWAQQICDDIIVELGHCNYKK